MRGRIGSVLVQHKVGKFWGNESKNNVVIVASNDLLSMI